MPIIIKQYDEGPLIYYHTIIFGEYKELFRWWDPSSGLAFEGATIIHLLEIMNPRKNPINTKKTQLRGSIIFIVYIIGKSFKDP